MITERLPFDPCLKVYWDFEAIKKDFSSIHHLSDKLFINTDSGIAEYEIRQFKDELYTEDTYYRFVRLK